MLTPVWEAAQSRPSALLRGNWGGVQKGLFLSRTDCESHKQVHSGGAVFQPCGSGTTLVMKWAVRSKVGFMHEYVTRRRNAARANICVRSVAREAYGVFPCESYVSQPSIIRKNGFVDAVYGSAEKTWGRNYFENNAVLKRYGWMLSYIIESPAGCDAEKSDACAQREWLSRPPLKPLCVPLLTLDQTLPQLASHCWTTKTQKRYLHTFNDCVSFKSVGVATLVSISSEHKYGRGSREVTESQKERQVVISDKLEDIWQSTFQRTI